MLLLCSGDVELNPGPNRKQTTERQTQVADEDDTSCAHRHNEVMAALSFIKTACEASAEAQAMFTQAVNDVKANQECLAKRLSNIDTRLASVETEVSMVSSLEGELLLTNDTINDLAQQNNELLSRINHLEDRSRRNNLIFYGVPDSNETWNDTEKNVISLLFIQFWVRI